MHIERFHVPEVSCQHCVHAVTSGLKTVPGVQGIQIDLGNKIVSVEHTDEVSTEALIEAINEAGYDEVAPVSA